METGFYTNYTEVKFIDKLKRSIDMCRSFRFSVSFIKKPGLRLLAPNIEAAIARGAHGQLITSTYQNFTDIDSLQFSMISRADIRRGFPADWTGSVFMISTGALSDFTPRDICLNL